MTLWSQDPSVHAARHTVFDAFKDHPRATVLHAAALDAYAESVASSVRAARGEPPKSVAWQVVGKNDGETKLLTVDHDAAETLVRDNWQTLALRPLYAGAAPTADTARDCYHGGCECGRLRDALDCGTNALRDSINASGNDAATNNAIVARMRTALTHPPVTDAARGAP